jgi:hypothetical protein
LELPSIGDQTGSHGDAKLGAKVVTQRLQGPEFQHHPVVGQFSATICLGCGFTQWWTKDPEDLLKQNLPGARIITGPDQGPYR